MTGDDKLLDLVAAVVDGDQPDWKEAESNAGSNDEQRFIRNLRLIAGVADVHRTHGSTTGSGGPTRQWAGPLQGKWGRFELIETIGEGAFGEVYRARDPLLNRTVAVKLLKSTVPSRDLLVARVLSEGQALAALDHPNIVKVYEAAEHEGRPGLCMEYVHGRTLQEQLASDGPFGDHEAALVGSHICRALAQVHSSGLVHCDVKPRNVMRAQGGRVVLMDFGAGLLQESALEGSASPTGTPLYLAPEILEHAAPTPQSDVYSVGVLLFHLVTRAYPFVGSSLGELREAHASGRRQNLHDLRPDLADGFVRVVDRALAPDPANRFATAGAMLSALTETLGLSEARTLVAPRQTSARTRTSPKRFGVMVAGLALVLAVAAMTWRLFSTPQTVGPSSRATLAVLPLRNLTGDVDWRVDAVTDDLMTTLGSLPGVRVSGWTSVLAVTKRADATVADIARSLGVDWIVEGSVRQAPDGPDRAVVTLRLLRASAGAPEWTTTFTKGIQEIYSVAREALPAVAARIGAAPPAETAARASHSQDPEARDAYLQARYLLRNQTRSNLVQARTYLEHAIELDPGYALAYSALARCLIDLEIEGVVPRSEMASQARDAINRAIALDTTLSEPYTRLGDIKLYYDFDWRGAGDAYQHAVELNPFDITARVQYSKYLAALGRVSESVDQARVAEDVDPISSAMGNMAMMQYYARRYDDSIKRFKRRVELFPGLAQVHFSLGRVYAARQSFDEAIGELEYAVKLGGNNPNVLDLAELARAHAQAGHADEARRRLAAIELANPEPAPSLAAYIGYVHAALGEKDAAFASLDFAVRNSAAVLLWAQVDPRLDPLRGDPRYTALLRQLELVR